MAIIAFRRKSTELELPEELLKEPRWMVWRLEDGRKVPYYPTTHRRRSGTMEVPEDYAQMTPHAIAMEALEDHSPAYSGLGLAITSGWLLIDLDDVMDPVDGSWKDVWAEEFTRRAAAAGAFTEISYSGSGVHVIGRGHARKAGHRGVAIEVYPNRRFVALTGRMLPGTVCPTGVVDCSELAEEALQEYSRRCEERGLNGPESALRPAEDRTSPCTVEGALLDQLNALLGVFTPDDREQWVKTGLALGRAFPRSREVFGAYGAWAKASPNYAGTRDDRTMEDIFFRQAAMSSTSRYTLDTMLRQAEAVGVNTKLFVQDFDELPRDAADPQRAARKFEWAEHVLKRGEFFDRPPPKPFVIAEVLPKARTAFIGRGGLGKTMLLLYEALHVVAGERLYDRFNILTPGRVLFLTAEEERTLMVRRAGALLDRLTWTEDQKLKAFEGLAIQDVSANIPKLIAHSRTGEFVVNAVVDKLIAGYKDADLKWLIIDPTASFGLSEQAMNDSATAIMEAGARMVEGLGAAVTFVHHVSKAGSRENVVDAHSGRGGSAFGDSSRASRVLTPRNDASGQSYDAATKTSRLTLHFVKNSYSAPLAPMDLDVIGGFEVRVAKPETVDSDAALEAFRAQLAENIRLEVVAGGFAPSIEALSRAGGYNMRKEAVRRRVLEELERGWLKNVQHPTDRRKRGVAVNEAYDDGNF